jgi:hypothetical protein
VTPEDRAAWQAEMRPKLHQLFDALVNTLLEKLTSGEDVRASLLNVARQLLADQGIKVDTKAETQAALQEIVAADIAEDALPFSDDADDNVFDLVRVRAAMDPF